MSVRNTDMSIYADALIAVWNGSSKGTRHMIGEMVKAKKPCHVIVDGKPLNPDGRMDFVW